MISFILLLKAWAYEGFFDRFLVKENTRFFMKNLDFSKIFLLGQEEMREGTLEILAYLFLGAIF